MSNLYKSVRSLKSNRYANDRPHVVDDFVDDVTLPSYQFTHKSLQRLYRENPKSEDHTSNCLLPRSSLMLGDSLKKCARAVRNELKYRHINFSSDPRMYYRLLNDIGRTREVRAAIDQSGMYNRKDRTHHSRTIHRSKLRRDRQSTHHSDAI